MADCGTVGSRAVVWVQGLDSEEAEHYSRVAEYGLTLLIFEMGQVGTVKCNLRLWTPCIIHVHSE